MFLQVKLRAQLALTKRRAHSGAGCCQDSLLLYPLSVLVMQLMTVIYRCNAFPMASWVGRRPSLSQHGWVAWLFNHPLSSTTRTPTLLEYIERAGAIARIYIDRAETQLLYFEIYLLQLSLDPSRDKPRETGI